MQFRKSELRTMTLGVKVPHVAIARRARLAET
jgi:hypothetical protein